MVDGSEPHIYDKPQGAPDVRAFYLEDAERALRRAGVSVGKIEFALPPRSFGDAEALAETAPDRLPAKTFRVLRSSEIYSGAGGGSVCDLLVTRENRY